MTMSGAATHQSSGVLVDLTIDEDTSDQKPFSMDYAASLVLPVHPEQGLETFLKFWKGPGRAKAASIMLYAAALHVFGRALRSG